MISCDLESMVTKPAQWNGPMLGLPVSSRAKFHATKQRQPFVMVSEMVFRWWINKLHRDDHVAVYEEPLNYGTELAPICVLPNGREKWNQHFRELFGI